MFVLKRLRGWATRKAGAKGRTLWTHKRKEQERFRCASSMHMRPTNFFDNKIYEIRCAQHLMISTSDIGEPYSSSSTEHEEQGHCALHRDQNYSELGLFLLLLSKSLEVTLHVANGIHRGTHDLSVRRHLPFVGFCYRKHHAITMH